MAKLLYQTRILLLALMTGAVGGLVSLILIWQGEFTSKVQWTLTVLVVSCWLGFAFSLREKVVRPLQTVANLLAGLREGDYSIRAHTGHRSEDSLAEIGVEINALEAILRGQRLDAVEATALVRKVITVIDVAVFAFDAEGKLRLVNRAGEMLMARPAERLHGRSAIDLGLEDCLMGDSPRTVQRSFPGKTGRWGLRRSTFREGGLPHQLLALADLSQALREEERQAWQRLVRVLGHELNNSLAPIKSMAGSLSSLLKRDPRPQDWDEDMARGLQVINSRTDSLTRFMAAYARLARLPEPSLQPVDLSSLVKRVARLENRLEVQVAGGPELVLDADPDQLEQLLINILKNAVEAAQEHQGGVAMGWKLVASSVRISVLDEGPGLPNTANLFVPFFTTKPRGSGIGLVLSRQIAEAHGGSLSLHNRSDTRGCEARLELPLAQSGKSSQSL